MRKLNSVLFNTLRYPAILHSYTMFKLLLNLQSGQPAVTMGKSKELQQYEGLQSSSFSLPFENVEIHPKLTK